jgi:GMP synthase (glutamine-hydrolysing)
VAAVLVHKAVGKQLTCIFVDHGLLRKDEGDQVEKVFKDTFDMNFIRVNVADRFLGKLKGVSDPEQKRKIIGAEFIHVLMKNLKRLALLISLFKELFIRTLWKAVVQVPALPLRAIIT